MSQEPEAAGTPAQPQQPDESRQTPPVEPDAGSAAPAGGEQPVAAPSEPPPGRPAGAPAAAPGQYAPVGAPRARRFGPAFARFSRSRATQVAAAMVVGAMIGGGTVAIMDNVYAHNQPSQQTVRPGQAGGPFGQGPGGYRPWSYGGFGSGAQPGGSFGGGQQFGG